MKIAIQGHPTRGKEVIQILESLGGKNTEKLEGTYKTFYYIDDEGEIGDDHMRNFPLTYTFYTIESFEKEFPFKVGDIVLLKGTNITYEIVTLEWFMNKLCYKLNNGFHYAPGTLTTYEKMKEERNITLTLDKAKEWYKKGGELKEIALQAFTKQELNPLPRSWEEYISEIPLPKVSPDRMPISSLPKKYIALYKLERLRDCWRQGWIPDYTKTYKKYRIKKLGTEYIVDWSTGLSDFLVFQTEELAKEFLNCFKDLIKQAGDLI